MPARRCAQAAPRPLTGRGRGWGLYVFRYIAGVKLPLIRVVVRIAKRQGAALQQAGAMWQLDDFYSRFGVLSFMLIHCFISYTYLFYNMFFPVLHVDALLRGLALQLTTVYGVPFLVAAVSGRLQLDAGRRAAVETDKRASI